MFEIGKFDRHRHRLTARDLPEVDEFDVQRDGPPRKPLPSQYPHSLATSGLSSASDAWRSTMSAANVSSAPIDLRGRSGSTARSSMARAI